MSTAITSAEFDTHMQPFLPLAGGKLLVAVSGGPDSLALAMLLQEWSEKNHTKIIAVTVDHGLRPEAAIEAAWVKKLFRQKNIDHHIITLTPPPHLSGIPAWARAARYDALELFGVAHQAHNLFLAHTQDDQIETIMMRLIDKSHWRGLSGMYPARPGKILTYIRPLLGEKKARLIATLARFDITECVSDPTNDLRKTGRGFIRNVFIPTLHERGFEEEKLIELGLASLELRQEEDQAVDQAIDQFVTFSELGYAGMALADYAKLGSELQARLMARIIDIIGAPKFPLRTEPFEAMMKRMPGTGTIGNCHIFEKSDRLYFVRETRNYPAAVELKGQGKCFFQGRFLIDYHVPDKTGYQLETLGKKRALEILAEGTLLVENVPLQATYFSLPCITYLDEVVSVPHLWYSKNKELVIRADPLLHQRQGLRHLRKGQKRE